MLTMNELFSGIGSQSATLDRLGIDFKVVGIAEIDKYAIKSYEAIHGPTRNYGDISVIEKLDYADFWTYSFPCQDISVAGKQRGISENTRSGLLYQVERLLEISKKCGELPKYLMLENVKNLVGKQFKPKFDEWLQKLDELGFNTYWQVLNAKNYGIPQNRERVFAISIRKDIDNGYEFPKGFDNGKRLKDILEMDVDEKYYISDSAIKRLVNDNKGYHSIIQKHEDAELSSTLFATMDRPARGCNLIADTPNDIIKEFDIPREILNDNERQRRVYNSDGISPSILSRTDSSKVVELGFYKYPNSEKKHQSNTFYDKNAISPTLDTMQGENRQPKIVEDIRIRKLTPLECWRLMGFTDEQFYKAAEVNFNSQLYKQAGNSIVVDVLYYLFKNLFIDKPTSKTVYADNKDQLPGQLSIFDLQEEHNE